mmetsp:Transcript_10283/g.15709  ORF Transcript_10283/g.15709 Transcript_10283/m.15709 type:complete len:495 (-) Transcript_10283:11-1495(-)
MSKILKIAIMLSNSEYMVGGLNYCHKPRHASVGMSIHRGTSLRSNPQDQDAEDRETLYSPNVALNPSKYRYDLEEDFDVSDIEDPSRTVNEYSFFDEATIYVRAGSGGQGSSTFKMGVGGQDGPPDGGNGGRGGDVIMVVDGSLNTLAGLTHAWRPNSFGGSGASYKNNDRIVRPKSFRAEKGQDGERQFKSGRYGKEVLIRVPPGTVVQEEVENQEEDDEHVSVTYFDIGTLTLDSPQLIVARGGEGGEGSAVTGKAGGRGVKRPRLSPVGGERKKLKLTLKIVADVALVGVPNAGKSTFLASVTRAKPKIANYPFTTVIPNLGVWIPPENDLKGSGGEVDKKLISGAGSTGLVLCDVPGLVAGAAKGVGLGHAFLRHVERCHVILHLVDATSIDPIEDFKMLNREIVKYGTGQLASMPQVVVVNKIDAFDRAGEDWEKGLKTKYTKEDLQAKLQEAMPHARLMWMSAKEKDGVDDLMTRMLAFVRKVKGNNA